jgi:hypothetical protein
VAVAAKTAEDRTAGVTTTVEVAIENSYLKTFSFPFSKISGVAGRG